MNVSGPLLMLLLTAACMVSSQKVDSVLELYRIIECVQPDVDPFKYVDYGCYCGPGGRGTPVDEVDQCCKVHDGCYGACMKNPECFPYFDMYDFTCTECQPTCSVKNNKCQAAACECDRALALCLAKFPYNPEYQHLNQTRCN